MPSVPDSDAAALLPELIARVSADREPVVLTRDGAPVAALVSVEDLRVLERLIERIEDEIDREEAERILADPSIETIPWEEVARSL